MASFNQVILLGNLVRDPELRVTPKGTAICQCGMAVNRTYKAEDGSNREEVTFVDFEAWGKTGELIAKYLLKGSAALITGRLKLDSWEDKQTQQKRSKLKVVVEQVQFIGSRVQGAPSDQPPVGTETQTTFPPRASTAPRPSRPTPPPQENIDEDVPF